MSDGKDESLEVFRRKPEQGSSGPSHGVSCSIGADGSARFDEYKFWPEDENGPEADREETLEFTAEDTRRLFLLLLRAPFAGETLTFDQIGQIAKENGITGRGFTWSHGGA